MNSVHRWFLGRFLIVPALFAVAGSTASRAAYFQADLDWLYYQDGAGRTLNWDLSSGTANANGVVTIPSSAYTLPPAEAGAVLTLEPDGGLVTKTFGSGVYRMAINQATPGATAIPTAAAAITVDGSPADWAGIDPYIQDPTGDVWWAGVPSGADVEYLKLAYSPDQSKLYILYKLTANANTGLSYRLFLNKKLGDNEGGIGVFQIDLSNFGSGWDVVSQGYLTDDYSSWYALAENGVAAVSGQYLEASVDTSAFGLPAKAIVFGKTALSTSPYTSLDQFNSSFKETSGAVYLNGDEHITVAAPTTWKAAARIRNFANVDFQGTCPYLRFAGAVLSGETRGDNIVQPFLEAFWITGDFDGTEVDNALVIMARVEKWSDSGEYNWDWNPVSGGGAVLTGLDPSTTVVDLKLDVTNNGKTVTFYYRTNSSSALNAGTWLTATSHTLPAGTGTMYGTPTTTPHVELETGFNRAAPVYRFWNRVHSRHVYTMDRTEKNKLATIYSHIFDYEGIKYYTYSEDSQPGALPIYRFWSNALSAHFYTISETEKDKLVNLYSHIWTYEGPVFYAFPVGSQPAGAKAVYRFWSNTLNCHFYTTSTTERDKLINLYSHVWTYEGPAFYTLAALFGG